jgi:hypothetical protein
VKGDAEAASLKGESRVNFDFTFPSQNNDSSFGGPSSATSIAATFKFKKERNFAPAPEIRGYVRGNGRASGDFKRHAPHLKEKHADWLCPTLFSIVGEGTL